MNNIILDVTLNLSEVLELEKAIVMRGKFMRTSFGTSSEFDSCHPILNRLHFLFEEILTNEQINWNTENLEYGEPIPNKIQVVKSGNNKGRKNYYQPSRQTNSTGTIKRVNPRNRRFPTVLLRAKKALEKYKVQGKSNEANNVKKS